MTKVPIGGGTAATLASVPGAGFGIAVDATSVYWVAGDGVWKVGLDGGNPTELAAGGGAAGIAVDEQSVYFGSADSVLKVPIAGGTPITLVSGQDQPSGIAVDSTSVYWSNVGTQGQGSLMRLTPK